MAALTNRSVSFDRVSTIAEARRHPRVIFFFFFSFDGGYIGEKRRNGQFPAVFMGR